MSWTGCVILLSGLVFMIGGWYSLGEMFSTDAEVMDNHAVRDTGLLSLVMHPAYSGIIQSLLGSSLAATSVLGALFTLCVVAPLWLRRAKYEEQLLIENLGQSYKDYAENMKWRRLVPRFFPIGV
jgi:protein-S-isoprenylcysteine O-methyltransferase Ste14